MLIKGIFLFCLLSIYSHHITILITPDFNPELWGTLVQDSLYCALTAQEIPSKPMAPKPMS